MTTATDQVPAIAVEVVDGQIFYYVNTGPRPDKPLDLTQARSALSSARASVKASTALAAKLEKAIRDVEAQQ